MPRATGAFFIALLLLSACSYFGDSVSEDEKTTFINIYTDLVLVKSKYDTNSKIIEKTENEIFKRNGISKEEFINFKDKISSNPDLQNEIYQRILKQLKAYRELPKDSLNFMIKELTLNKLNK